MAEAIDAIRTDFNQYPPQRRLFMDLCPLILGPEITVIEDARNHCMWISRPGPGRKNRMRPTTARDLGQTLLNALQNTRPSTGVMAEICRKTFQTRAQVAGNGEKTGVWIDTDMQGFACRQCGRCCRVLDYRHELSAADYRHWRILGRNDILERVATIRHGSRIVSYAMWVEPGTRRFSETCPWLTPAKPNNLSGPWICRIHEVKPGICRQYPGTRKHAQMTGCAGFGG
ncbi:MAG: YkgJ family cysteine cluster protein [Desulfobacterales bacterium]|nr:YkgJ family cysteine cluster protein [Desulfobacterales bacterium]